MSKQRASEYGFTAVEMLITIIVAAMFTTVFYQLFGAINNAATNARQQAVASDKAYAYLRKYASAGTTPTWFTCDTASGSSNTNDLTINSNATGQILESGTLTGTISLPGPVTYKVTALAIYGCNGSNLQKPIRVEAEVKYGPRNVTIRHTSLVGY